MIKIEALTLEEAYREASLKLKCSVTELKTEVVQHPSSGFLGLFKKSAIIVATCEVSSDKQVAKVKKDEQKLQQKTTTKNQTTRRV